MPDFQLDGKTLSQMSIRKLKEHMKIDSAIKVSKAISMASKRDLQNFDSKYAKVLKVDELQPIEEFFIETVPKEGQIPQGTEPTEESALQKTIKIQRVRESVVSLFGDSFYNEYDRIERSINKQRWAQKIQKEYGLERDEALIYGTFLKTIDKKDYARKAFGPFISRTPGSFLKCKDYFGRLLSVLRRFPKLEEGTYEISTRHNIKDFKAGGTFVFPSFALGTKSDKTKEKKKGSGIILRISGKTSIGHALEGDKKGIYPFPFYLSPINLILLYFIICRKGYLRTRGFFQGGKG